MIIILLLLSCIKLIIVNLHVIVYSACYVTYNRARTCFYVIAKSLPQSL